MHGVWLVLGGALIWSTGGVAIKWLPMSPLAVSALRSLLAALLFLAILRGGAFRPVGHRGWWWTGAVSYAYVVTSFVFATRLTTAANAIFLQYTAPLWVMLLAGRLLGERVTATDIGALVIGGAGVGLCLSGGFRGLGDGALFSTAMLGDLLGVTSGIAFGLCTLSMRRANRIEHHGGADGDARSFLFVGNVIAAGVGFAIVLGLPGERAAFAAIPWGGAAIAVMVWLGFFHLGGGYLMVQHGLRSVTAMQASLLTLVEPILNPVWVAAGVGERPSAETLAGGALVLGALALSVVARPRERRVAKVEAAGD